MFQGLAGFRYEISDLLNKQMMRMHKIRAASVYGTMFDRYVYTEKFHSKLVYVGLTQITPIILMSN